MDVSIVKGRVIGTNDLNYPLHPHDFPLTINIPQSFCSCIFSPRLSKELYKLENPNVLPSLLVFLAFLYLSSSVFPPRVQHSPSAHSSRSFLFVSS